MHERAAFLDESNDHLHRPFKSNSVWKLEPVRGPKGFIVIDRIERPTPNDAAAIVDRPARALGGGR